MTQIIEKQEQFRLWLQSELTKRGWSQSELARRGKISQATVSDIVSGRQRPGDRAATAISIALGYPLAEVRYRAGLTNEEPKEPTSFQALVARAAMLRPADVPLVIQLIDRLNQG